MGGGNPMTDEPSHQTTQSNLPGDNGKTLPASKYTQNVRDYHDARHRRAEDLAVSCVRYGYWRGKTGQPFIWNRAIVGKSGCVWLHGGFSFPHRQLHATKLNHGASYAVPIRHPFGTVWFSPALRPG